MDIPKGISIFEYGNGIYYLYIYMHNRRKCNATPGKLSAFLTEMAQIESGPTGKTCLVQAMF